ncbi:hypothetical protein DICPUDRAFT_79257 [Dictyostelium purpureum]|uniref:Cornichon family protein n=1 Tax=Dictyostelium purpureum TaxID=5786 RepID=F0ZM15_DICPU|nr:uncharacterized protein DICPUDRAFT_79257 [Dictyostelium purpureum]EGC35021.1 hypothetical protein DICPUDRAFT_79257 [Dictyostelium purpureum]|eukprot:XP_003288449.1 hypothetical protein DICPUDRAFT_79257 [Dictyostelium purpureum]
MDIFILYWIFILVITAGLVSASVFCIVALQDLEADLVNPIDLSRRLNPLFKSEITFHIALCLLFFVNFEFILLLVNSVLLGFNIYWMLSGQNKIFAADIFKLLPVYKKRYTIKVIFYIVTFFLYLYWFISYLVHAYAGPSLKSMKIPTI